MANTKILGAYAANPRTSPELTDVLPLGVPGSTLPWGMDLQALTDLVASSLGSGTARRKFYSYVNDIRDSFPGLPFSMAGDTEVQVIATFSAALTTIDVSGCTALRYAAFRLGGEGNDIGSSFDFTGCTALERLILNGGAAAAIDLSMLSNLTLLYIDHYAALIVDLAGLTSLVDLTIEDVANSTLDLSVVPALESVILLSFASLTSVDLSGLSAVQNFTMRGCGGITALDFTDMTALERVIHETNANLADVTITSTNAIDEYIGTDCALTEASVNGILVALDGSGVEDGEVDLSGGTSASPSGAGATAVTSLEGKGWTVTVN